MNILQSFKRTRFFLFVNIVGLAIGLSVAIMLTLYITNEFSYDRHFANHNRIVRLMNKLDIGEMVFDTPRTLRKAFTELPGKIPGIEAVTQIYEGGFQDVTYREERRNRVATLLVDPDFPQVFQLKFIEGTAGQALRTPEEIVINRTIAEALYGSPAEAMRKTLTMHDQEYLVAAVVEDLPENTHFGFDILRNLQGSGVDQYESLEYFTYYLIKENADVKAVSEQIGSVYTAELMQKINQEGNPSYGYTEKLTDIYLKGTGAHLGKGNDIQFIRLLIVLAALILILAIANFANLYTAQGETRMNEIAVRKTNGANPEDIVRLFFSEVSLIVSVAFIIGIFGAYAFLPYFSQLIGKAVVWSQWLNGYSVVVLLALFVVTVSLSAAYPSFYLSRFQPLEIFGKRIPFSKQQFKNAIVVFQSVITIVLLSYIMMINKQTTYLQNLPLNFKPENVLIFELVGSLPGDYEGIRSELLRIEGVEDVSGTIHFVGQTGSFSGEGVNIIGDAEKYVSANGYRTRANFPAFMGYELVAGTFFDEDRAAWDNHLIVNEAFMKRAGLSFPVENNILEYGGRQVQIVGVVKDFVYDQPGGEIEPLMISVPAYRLPGMLYVRLQGNANTGAMRTRIESVFNRFAPGVEAPMYRAEEIHGNKFNDMKSQERLVGATTLLSLLIAMLGLLAIHLFTTLRRTKEIGIRRINGASPWVIFSMLTKDIIKLIVIAGVIAVPVAYYFLNQWLSGFPVRASIGWLVFVVPVLIQCFVAVLTTAGVSWHVLSRNPVEAIKG